MTYDQYQEMKIRIEWDVAWRIFDHVNESNDSSKHIDLNCLDVNEAMSIVKQQIYEIAQNLKPSNSGAFCGGCNGGYVLSGEGTDYQVLSVQCAEDHMVIDGKNKTNGILKMVSNELRLDHYYLPSALTILVKIDKNTINNSALKDW